MTGAGSNNSANTVIRPRRSVLYMPGSNERAMRKATGIACDAVIVDLEDAVAPDAKVEAREQVVALLSELDFGARELMVRVNGIDTPWFKDDVQAVVGLPIDALVLPKIESASMLGEVENLTHSLGAESLPLWPMIETPLGVVNAAEIASASSRVNCMIMGTSDLNKELRLRVSAARTGLQYALSQCVLAARVAGIDILDGVFLDLEDEAGFEAECQQGLELGFDGKTLVHPKQVAPSNDAYGVDAAAVDEARALLEEWECALQRGDGVAVYRGKLVENLHADAAVRLVARAEAIAALASG